MDSARIPVFDDVLAAVQRLDGVAKVTPVMTSRSLDAASGCQFFFKCENLQRMGAFKFRGAYNAMSQLSAAQRAPGVLTFSSGNHAQAVALAGRELGIKTTIIMPRDAPKGKLAATRGYGAEVVLYDRYADDREALTRKLQAEHGYTVIPPFNHPDIIAGQGTAAHELLQTVGTLDVLITPLGGGGLLAGSALAAHGMAPDCAVYGVEPAAGNDAQQSLQRGEIVRIDTPHTIADGAQTQAIGEYTFAIIREQVNAIWTASDAELITTMRFFAERMKILVEPTGCLGLAAARQHLDQLKGKRVGIILSGGNVDLSRFAELLQQAD